jgi:hypothetical protein
MSLLINFGDHTKYENDIQMYSIVFENIFFQFLIGSYTYKLTVRAFENKTFTREDFSFTTMNFSLTNFQQHLHMVCDSHQDFLDRRLSLTRMIQKQGLIAVNLK